MKEPFSGWREGFRFYFPVITVGTIVSILLIPYGLSFIGWPVLAIGIGMMLFFRDFPRKIVAGGKEVVSPADGTIVGIERLDATPHFEGPCQRISVFLSVFSVHINRAPYPGVVRETKYRAGGYYVAMKPETSELNESNAVHLDTPDGPMTVRQISGAVARRIVCPVEKGATLAKGEKFGMIRFGSRTELYLPLHSEICVKLKQKVSAGLTVVARMP